MIMVSVFLCNFVCFLGQKVIHPLLLVRGNSCAHNLHVKSAEKEKKEKNIMLVFLWTLG